MKRMFQYPQKFFLKYSKKTTFCGVEKDPSVTISGLQKKQGVGADIAVTGQCSPPLHNTDQKRPLLYIVKKNDAGV